MVTELAGRCLLTVVFAAAGLGTLLAMGRAGAARGDGRLSDVFHLMMCAAVFAMIWWSEPALAGWLQTAVFGCAVVWFSPVSPAGTARLRPASLAGTHHALMAGGMIWMLTAGPADMRMAPAGIRRTAMPAMSHDSMPAMSHHSMPAMSHHSMLAMSQFSRPAAVLAVSVLLAVYFALAAIPWLVQAVGPRRRVNGAAAASHAVMSAGMAAMLLAML